MCHDVIEIQSAKIGRILVSFYEVTSIVIILFVMEFHYPVRPLQAVRRVGLYGFVTLNLSKCKFSTSHPSNYLSVDRRVQDDNTVNSYNYYFIHSSMNADLKIVPHREFECKVFLPVTA